MTLKLSLKDKLRLNDVKRWHLCDTVRVQNVAEHSYNVAQISIHLCEALGWSDVNECCRLAVIHDEDEVVTGDMPSNNKDKNLHEIFGGELSSTKIVKMADFIDAYTWFYVNRSKSGHSNQVMEWMESRKIAILECMCEKEVWAIVCTIYNTTNGDYTI